MKSILAFLVLAALGAGCASNPFVENYRPDNSNLVAAEPLAVGHGSVPQVESGRVPPGEDASRLLREGYVRLGDAAFRSTDPGDKKAIAQAKAVGADLVMIYRSNAQTVTGINSYPVSNPQTIGVYGPKGHVTHVVTTSGTRTEYETYQYQICDHLAIFWAKGGTPILGACLREPNPEEKQRTGSNKGAVVAAVVKRSPAFAADLLEGDLLQAIDGQAVLDPQNANLLLEERRGREIQLDIRRNSGPATIKVKLNP